MEERNCETTSETAPEPTTAPSASRMALVQQRLHGGHIVTDEQYRPAAARHLLHARKTLF